MYRFWLERSFPAIGGIVTFVMLNPSTADDAMDDPTIRRCKAFALAWGYATMLVVNTNPTRATDPRNCTVPAAATLTVNDQHIQNAARNSGAIVCAWGNNVDENLDRRTRALLRPYAPNVCHLGLTKLGQPRHPLYLPKSLKPTRWESI